MATFDSQDIPNFNPQNPGDRYLKQIFVASPQDYPGTVKLTCRTTGEIFEVERNQLKYCSLYGSLVPNENEELFLPKTVIAEDFVVVLEFLRHFLEDSVENHEMIKSMIRCTPLDTQYFHTKVPDWYNSFVNRYELHNPKLHRLIRAVLDIGFDVMRLVLCAYIACSCKLLTPAQICEKFNVPLPTDEQIEEVKRMIKEHENADKENLLSDSSSSSSAKTPDSAAEEESNPFPSAEKCATHQDAALKEEDDENEDLLIAALEK